jgi:hypothetical protein
MFFAGSGSGSATGRGQLGSAVARVRAATRRSRFVLDDDVDAGVAGEAAGAGSAVFGLAQQGFDGIGDLSLGERVAAAA